MYNIPSPILWEYSWNFLAMRLSLAALMCLMLDHLLCPASLAWQRLTVRLPSAGLNTALHTDIAICN